MPALKLLAGMYLVLRHAGIAYSAPAFVAALDIRHAYGFSHDMVPHVAVQV
jgi:hypothetical protein